jgi:polar amino acid transport system substrate-binding protein
MILAMIVGLLTALTRMYGPRPFSWMAVSFVEVFRGTPLLIQLYLIFYGLPHIGLRFDPFLAAVIGLGLNYGACEAENYRAGILSIPKSQMDASQALGMSWRQSMRHIILPQAIRVVIPPVTNDFIALLKDSSLVSVISMVELTTTYGQLASTYFDYLGIGLLTAGIYFLIGLPFVRLSRYFESQLHMKKQGPARTSSGAMLRLIRFR